MKMRNKSSIYLSIYLTEWESCRMFQNLMTIEGDVDFEKHGSTHNCVMVNLQRCQLLSFSVVYWSVTILNRRPTTFNNTVLILVIFDLAPSTVVGNPHNNPFTLHFVRHKVKSDH